VKNNIQWYDHTLVGDYEFNLSASWINSQSFPDHVTLTGKLPVDKQFKAKIISVCSDFKVVKPVIEDMKLNLEPGIAVWTQFYLQFTEN
jgi:hypothetical protein